MNTVAGKSFRYIGTKRRTKEDPRFVTGRGRFVADIALPGMKHVALITSPHAAARIKAIRAEPALAMPGVQYVPRIFAPWLRAPFASDIVTSTGLARPSSGV